MNKMKRFACILLSLIMVLVLVLITACNSSDGDVAHGQDKGDYEAEKETDKKEEGSDEKEDSDEHECTVSDWTVTEATCLAALSEDQTYYVVVYYDNVDNIPDVFNGLPVRIIV